MFRSNLFEGVRVNQFSNGRVALKAQNAPIGLGALQKFTPSVFAAQAHESRSEAFRYVPTAEILEGLQGEGFEVWQAMQGGSGDEGKRGFTKHMLRLRHRSMSLVNVGDSIPEIVLMNAHDGTSAYKLMAGVFRLVCSNGLVVKESTFGDVSVPHKGADIVGRVIEATAEVVRELPMVSEKVREFQALTLSEPEALAFSRAALVARYGENDDGQSAAPIAPHDALTARRAADRDPTLWNVFNRLQENLTQGGIGYRGQARPGRRAPYMHTRAVTSVDGTVGVNRALWTLASEMAKIKSQAI